MGTRQVAAAIVCLSCASLTVSCLQNPTASPTTDPGEAQGSNGPEQIGETQQESGAQYQSKDFAFVVSVQDDGKDDGGGWQTAGNTFHFVERNWGIPRYRWKCPLAIGMPIRSQLEGRITPSRAALYSAEVANAVVDPLLDSQATWENQGAAFCIELEENLQAMFRLRYPNVGARVELR